MHETPAGMSRFSIASPLAGGAVHAVGSGLFHTLLPLKLVAEGHGPDAIGLVVGAEGAGFLLGSSYKFAPEHLTGDIYGMITALFFGAYFLAVRPARRHMPAGVVIFRSSLVTAAVLLVVALSLEDTVLPASLHGLAMLLCLAFVSHAGGQGLLAFALGHLPAAFSSIVILIEGVAAAVFGWIILGEHLTLLQLTGSLAIFAGIFFARPRRAKALP